MEYRRYLESLSQAELQDLLEAIWRGENDATPEQIEEIKSHLRKTKTEELAKYVAVWLVLLTLAKITIQAKKNKEDDGEEVSSAKKRGGAFILSLARTLPEPTPPADYDLVWITKGDDKVCPICRPLHGKVWGRDFSVKPDLHPGCRCELVKMPKGRRSMDEIRTLQAGAIRALEEGGRRRLEVLAIPFGSPDRRDKLGEYLSPNTDVMMKLGDRRPLLYLHGHSPRKRPLKVPKAIGDAVYTRTDSRGHWMIADLDDSELSDRTWESALRGKAKASTGSMRYLVRIAPDGEVLSWAVAELSVWDGGDDRIPVSDDAVVLPLRALFETSEIDYPFETGEDKDAVRTIKSGDFTKTKEQQEKEKMDEKEFKRMYAEEKAREEAEKEAEASLRAKIREEEIEKLKKVPAYRSSFNVNYIDDSDAKKDADKEETFAYVRALIQDAKIARDGGIPTRLSRLGYDPSNPNAMRVLEETEALELGPMVPTDLHNQIHGLLGKYSLVDKIAGLGKMSIYKTDKLTFSAPTETTAMTALSDIAEEGAYTENEMAFAAKNATMQKVGNYLSVTEEALEDQDLFQQYLAKACAKAIALSKNADLYALLATVDGTEIATEATFTDGEIVQTLYYGLAQEYRENAVFIMNDATLGYVRSMLIATPRAYGEFGFAPMSMGELGERFLNHYVFTNGNWTNYDNATQDDLKLIDFVDLDECLYWVERRKLGIFVDPYSTRLSAGTVNFLPSARYGGVVVNASALSGLDGHEA